jgi:hypothetical protein
MDDDSARPPDYRSTVGALLAAAGLSPSESEFEHLVEQYPMLRAVFDMMWMVPGIRYEIPALTFRA